MENFKGTLFHYHKIGIHDELWQEGKSIIVDNKFVSYFSTILNEFSTAVPCPNNDHLESFRNVVDYYLEDENFNNIDRATAKRLLRTTKAILSEANIYNRERALEDYRKLMCPELPSRIHSIWLSDKISLPFWKQQLGYSNELNLYKISLDGIIFKSSDAFLPDDYMTVSEMYQAAEFYWHPKFKTKLQKERAEYLFQGEIKVLKKL